MNRVFLDASAWIEYLAGTEKGRIIRDEITKPKTLVYTSGMVVAEVVAKRLREEKPVEIALAAMKSVGIIVPLDFACGELTARIYIQHRKFQKKFGLVDAHFVAAGRAAKTTIITCDNDFRGLTDVRIV